MPQGANVIRIDDIESLAVLDAANCSGTRFATRSGSGRSA